mmetsp:Transcript_21515/g.28826  ORF Transcript_21515/g.28826 Transcript_21515/m.28826 type:complete len:114 (-) Transcript_21515:1932-2273(-)|eukprot:CAMPEP_0185593416 /NCGR_PEP_ID=MMETSP0434-20130131/71379_1 /TAXON_ID=626734 ORGANISM="Favella taraikaensis, Strain Fe Narragansett Bay" /NCGR_SAMPLE_ID=MMETSP0434 /ASSEMBLY_ACC=CAM_ASM_000379 /LENGTH=113 /DNA_ID=CAMNT_0028219973 /DNA_START=20 /DNA_END=364 /DNA_ORIENTATION=-
MSTISTKQAKDRRQSEPPKPKTTNSNVDLSEFMRLKLPNQSNAQLTSERIETAEAAPFNRSATGTTNMFADSKIYVGDSGSNDVNSNPYGASFGRTHSQVLVKGNLLSSKLIS